MKEIYFAFAFNEFNYRRISFSQHKSFAAAQGAAHRKSGQDQRRKRRDFNGAESATDDLEATVVTGIEAFQKWANDGDYLIDWEDQMLIYRDPVRGWVMVSDSPGAGWRMGTKVFKTRTDMEKQKLPKGYRWVYVQERFL